VQSGGQSRLNQNLLNLQGIDALQLSAPSSQVFICACRRPQLNTLEVNTQIGASIVPQYGRRIRTISILILG
jgi:hypothetical protein